MNLKKLVPLASLALCAGLLATSCSKDEPTPSPAPGTKTKPTGTQEATIAITLRAKVPTYFSFLKNDVSKLTPEQAKNNKDWDIAFLGLNGLTNSGDNGEGKVAVLRTETDNFDGVVNVTPFLAPSNTWVSDATIEVTHFDRMPPYQATGTYNKLLVEAYSFDMKAHPPTVVTKKNVYLVRTAAGDYVKMQIIGVEGYESYKIRYAYLGTSGENKLTPIEPQKPGTDPSVPKTPGEARIAVATPGTLESTLQGEDLSKLTKLIVTSGTLNQKDLDFVTKSLKIEEINLTAATLSLKKEDLGFYNNSTIKKIIAPANLERTEHNWFSNTMATSITFPGDKLKYFGGATYNEKLTSITLPSSVEVIGDGSFAGSNYEQITLPSSLKVIPKEAFKGCRRLTELTIPANVVEIRDLVFSGCAKLKKITFLCPAPEFTHNAEDENAFEGYEFDIDPSFIVPKGTRDAYLKALGWSSQSPVGQRVVEAE